MWRARNLLCILVLLIFSTASALDVYVQGGGKTRCIGRTFLPGSDVYAEFVSRNATSLRVTVWDWGRRIVGGIGRNVTHLHMRTPGIGTRSVSMRGKHSQRILQLKYRFCVRSRRPTYVRFVIRASNMRTLESSMRRLKRSIAKMHALENQLDTITADTVRVSFYTTFLSFVAIFVSLFSLLLVDESCGKVARASLRRFSLIYK